MWSERTDERTSLLYVDGYFVGLGEYGTLSLIRANPEKAEVVSRLKIVDAGGKELIGYPAWAAPILSNGFSTFGKRLASVPRSQFAEMTEL